MMPNGYDNELDVAIRHLKEYGKKRRYYFFGASFEAPICWKTGTDFTIDGTEEIALRNEIKEYDKASFWWRWYKNVFHNMEKKRAQLYYAQALRLLCQMKSGAASCFFSGEQFLNLSDRVKNKLNNSFSLLRQIFQENSLRVLNMMRYFNKPQATENKYSESARAKSFQKKHFLCYQLEAEKLYQDLRGKMTSKDERLIDTYNVFIWKMKLAATCADASNVEEIFVQQNDWIQSLSSIAEKQHIHLKSLAHNVQTFQRNADRNDKFKKFRLMKVKGLISHLNKIANYSLSSQVLLDSKGELANAEKAFKGWKSEYDNLMSSYENYTKRQDDLKEIFEVKLAPVQRDLHTFNTKVSHLTPELLACLKKSKETPQQTQQMESDWVCIVKNYLFWSNSYFFYIESHCFLDTNSTNLAKGWQDFVDKAKNCLSLFESEGIPADSKRLIAENIDSTIKRLEADIKRENSTLQERSCIRLEAYRELQKFLIMFQDKFSTPPEKKYDCQLENPSIVLKDSSLEFSVKAQSEATRPSVSFIAGQGGQGKAQPTPAFDAFSLKPPVTALVEATVLPVSSKERQYHSQIEGSSINIPEVPPSDPSELEPTLLKMPEKKAEEREEKNNNPFLFYLGKTCESMDCLLSDLRKMQRKNYRWKIEAPEAQAIYDRFNDSVRNILLNIHPDKVSQSSAVQAGEIFFMVKEAISTIKDQLKSEGCSLENVIKDVTYNLELLHQKIKKYQNRTERDEYEEMKKLVKEIVKDRQRQAEDERRIYQQLKILRDEFKALLQALEKEKEEAMALIKEIRKGMEEEKQAIAAERQALTAEKEALTAEREALAAEKEALKNEIEKTRQAREVERQAREVKRKAREAARQAREAKRQASIEMRRKMINGMVEIREMMRKIKLVRDEGRVGADPASYMLEKNTIPNVLFNNEAVQVNQIKLFSVPSEQPSTAVSGSLFEPCIDETKPAINSHSFQLFVPPLINRESESQASSSFPFSVTS